MKSTTIWLTLVVTTTLLLVSCTGTKDNLNDEVRARTEKISPLIVALNAYKSDKGFLPRDRHNRCDYSALQPYMTIDPVTEYQSISCNMYVSSEDYVISFQIPKQDNKIIECGFNSLLGEWRCNEMYMIR